ncbi:hypothetical protein PINS_up017131 [Pythium insidiosum]|nr:hypothetical protein PINS_up017131 [Pythium insidiosum]
MVRGHTDDGVARNLLPEIEEEAKKESPQPAVELETPAGSPMVDAPPLVIDLTGAERAEPRIPETPATRAMNVFPPQFPPDWIPARALELLTAKNDVLKCLKVTKVSPSGEIRDPGFALMNDRHQLVAAIIGVFNTGGCSVVVDDYERILRFPVERLRAAGQATYDLFLRHQAWKLITAAAKSSLHGLVDGSDLQKLAEKYMGHSKEEVIEMREEVARQKAMILSLEGYLQDMADQQTRLQTSLERSNKEVEELKAKSGQTSNVLAEDLSSRREKTSRRPSSRSTAVCLSRRNRSTMS